MTVNNKCCFHIAVSLLVSDFVGNMCR